MAAALDRADSEVDPFKDYRVYLALLTEFLAIERRAAPMT
jgi:hypothetical protein